MTTAPYPLPASRAWVAAMAAGYGGLALAGLLVLILLVVMPQPASGVLVLGIWGGTTLPGAAACMYGVLRARYRFEWIGAWLLVLGVSVYLVVTILGVLALPLVAIVTSLPTILVFVSLILVTLGRAIQLSIVDKQARVRVIADPDRGPE